MAKPTWVDAAVTADGRGPYPARITNRLKHTAWFTPHFTRTVVDRIAADLAAAHADTDPHQAQAIRFDGDVALLVQAPGTDAEHVLDRFEPDAGGYYSLAAYWTWSTVDPTAKPGRAESAATDAWSRVGDDADAVGLPPGARPLSADAAVDLIVTGHHPEAATGNPALDAVLVEGLRAGLLVACQHADGQLAFTRTDAPPTP